MQSDTIEEVRGLVATRIGELEDERGRLEGALEVLSVRSSSNGDGPTPARAKRGRPRKRRSGTRTDEALKLIVDSPGITASEIARAMKIKPNYLYRVLTDLTKQKLVKKDGRKYFTTVK